MCYPNMQWLKFKNGAFIRAFSVRAEKKRSVNQNCWLDFSINTLLFLSFSTLDLWLGLKKGDRGWDVKRKSTSVSQVVAWRTSLKPQGLLWAFSCRIRTSLPKNCWARCPRKSWLLRNGEFCGVLTLPRWSNSTVKSQRKSVPETALREGETWQTGKL